jgi:hypothetical protein
MGHTVRRCKQPIKEDEAATGGTENVGFDTAEVTTPGGGNGWDKDAATTGGSANNEWENTAPAPIAAGGGGW